MSNPPPVPARGRRQPVEQGGVPTAVAISVHEEELERSDWAKFWENLNGQGGLSLMLSFFLHMILLALMAIPVIRSLQQNQQVTSVVHGETGEGALMGEPGGMELSLHDLQPASSKSLMDDFLLNERSLAPTLLPDVNPADLPSLPSDAKAVTSGKGGRGSGSGTGLGDGTGGEGGIRIMAPPNAIRAGSFTVFAWPIIGTDARGKVVHGPAGSSPQVLQAYHIVIRLTVPEGKKSVNLNDFSGHVRGSDSYTQKIPQDAWFYNGSGDLVRARSGRAIPVVDGTAELLIRVPGAGVALVRDTITVASRLTKEEQEIELEFADSRRLQ